MTTKTPRDLLNEFNDGLKNVSKSNPDNMKAFMSLLQESYKPAALDTKTKEIISCAIAVYNRCEYCIVFHVYSALKAGAKRAEIMDSAMTAVAFGGGPSMAFAVTLLKDSIDEFEKDFV